MQEPRYECDCFVGGEGGNAEPYASHPADKRESKVESELCQRVQIYDANQPFLLAPKLLIVIYYY